MSAAPDATAYAAPRSASVPVAHMFSSRETGMPSRRSAVAAGMAELPTLIRSKQDPVQAASIRPRSIPASARASSNASASNPSVPTSQRSPKREHPIPMIATLSLMPVAITHSFRIEARSVGRRCLPEIPAIAPGLVALLDSKAHLKLGADAEGCGIDIDEFHEEACPDVELRKPDI